MNHKRKRRELSGLRTMTDTLSPPPTGRLPTEIEVTPEMIRAGHAAYAEVAGWDPSPEELDAGLVACFLAMISVWTARH